MKLNKLILLVTGLVIILVLVMFTFTLRNAIYQRRAIFHQKPAYVVIPSGEFRKLSLKGRLDIDIRSGKNWLVEYLKDSSTLTPQVSVSEGVLYIETDSLQITGMKPVMQITMPSLIGITADQHVNIRLGSFGSDSIHITLGEGCTFIGSSNAMKHLKFNASGNALIRFDD